MCVPLGYPVSGLKLFLILPGQAVRHAWTCLQETCERHVEKGKSVPKIAAETVLPLPTGSQPLNK